MASPGSFIRSAAQATSSAYRRLPIRWRIAGGSALLTLVILLGFAAIVGVLTTRQIRSDFNREVDESATDLQSSVRPRPVLDESGFLHHYEFRGHPISTPTPRARRAQSSGSSRSTATCSSRPTNAPYLPPPREKSQEYNGYLVESRPVELAARRSSTCSMRASCPTSRRPPTACASSSASA